MTEPRLGQALSEERRGRYLDSLRLCLQVLADEPRNAAALALASRLSRLASDTPNAIAYACEAVRCEPGNPLAREAMQTLVPARAATSRAIEVLTQAIGIEPDITRHVAVPGSLPLFERINEVYAIVSDALAHDPGLAQAHAVMGNLCVRRGEYLAALGAYQRATFIADRAEYALALSDILFTLNEHSGAAYFRERALAKQRLYADPVLAKPQQCSVLALMTPGPWSANTPLDFALNRSNVRLARLYLGGGAVTSRDLAPYDVVFNAIGEAEQAQLAIRQANELARGLGKPLVNTPSNSYRTARTEIARALRAVPGCFAPAAQRIAREQLPAWTAFPLLARPVDSHGGRGLSKLGGSGDIAAYLRVRSEPFFDVTPFVEYCSADGHYRKYRVILVEGVPYPYHLAISPAWMVHYAGSPTGTTPWMQAEEARFLAQPRNVFTAWEETFGAIARALGLDYFAIDCSLLPDGRVLVFEADIAGLVHCAEPAGSYKYRYVPQIFRALEKLLLSKVRR